MEKGGYSDSQLVSHFKGLLVAVTTVSLLTHIQRTIWKTIWNDWILFCTIRA